MLSSPWQFKWLSRYRAHALTETSSASLCGHRRPSIYICHCVKLSLLKHSVVRSVRLAKHTVSSVACLPNSPSMLQVLCKLCHNVSLPLPQTSRCPHTNTSSVGSYKGLNDLINRTHAPRVNRHLCHQHHIVLSFIPIRHHGFNPVHVRAEAPQLHLLALARFDRQRVGIDPLVGRHVSGL